MYDIAMLAHLLVYGGAAVASLPLLFFTIRAIIRKQWHKLRKIVITTAVVALTAKVGMTLLHKAVGREYSAGVYDVSIDVDDPIFEYDSERSIHGDGYSISVYALPDSIRERFEAADDRLTSQFPKLPSYRNKWKVIRWQKTPLDPSHQNYLAFAGSTYDAERSDGLPAHLGAMRDALSREGSFYAFLKFDHGSSPGNIDFFVVDLKGGKLYEINHNT